MRRAWSAIGLVLAVAGCGDDGPREFVEDFDASSVGWLLSVWGPSPDRVYAAGGEPDDGVLLEREGGAWTEVTTPSVPLLNWVYGFDADDVWVVGNAGTALHFDGADWREVSTPTDQDLWGVWGAAPDDVWAVGGNGRMEGQATLLHWDGRSWTREALPDLERPGVNALFKVWGTSASRVIAVGQQGAVLEYDGTQWLEVGVGASEDLIALWGTGPDEIVIVGGRNSGQIVTWDGAEWSQRSLGPLPGLNGVWVDGAGSGWLVGQTGVLVPFDFPEPRSEELGPTFLDYHAVFGFEGGATYAVGGSFQNPNGPFEGVLSRRGDGS